MAEPKTKPTKASVAAFINAVEHEGRREDAKALDRIFREITGAKPVLWGPSIIGYGEYTNVTTAGEAAWPKAGFSPRKTNLVLYITPKLLQGSPLLKKLGKHKTGKSCLYINRLSDIDEGVLRELIVRSWKHMEQKHT